MATRIGDVSPCKLWPRTGNELIIIYSKLTDMSEKNISFKERIMKIINRCESDNSLRLCAIKKAKENLSTIKEDIESNYKRMEIDLNIAHHDFYNFSWFL